MDPPKCERDTSAELFLSSLSHEIRTPLNGIVGYTQLLLQTKLDSTQKIYLNSMNHCSIQLMSLINDILDLSKLTTGKMPVNNECFNFKEVVDEVNATLGYKINEKRQKISFNTQNNENTLIVADKSKIIQIMINLISNSIKFTDIGGDIIVSVSIVRDTVMISVKDNGIGIPEKNQEHIFEPFYQAPNSLTKNGSGLGLAICKKLVNLLSGEIHFTSTEGIGTTFTFSFKFEKFEKFKIQVEQNSKILRNKYVLVVDDNVDNRLITGEMLFEYDMRPVVCSSAREAIRLINNKRYPFSLALLDICMPDISGVELAKQIKDVSPELPLIALSSIDDPINMTNFEFYIQKPIHKVKLIDIINKVIGRDSVDKCILDTTEITVDSIIPKEKQFRILIAEDVENNTNILLKMLESMGYRNIDAVINGEEAIIKIEQEFTKGNPYDILLLDLKMPKVDGFGVAEHIKNKGYVKPKIAALTASVLESDKEACKRLGVKYFIIKPINMNHLRLVLKYLVCETIKP
jgi:two-component system sensor histidine kinase/response regulator